MADTPEVHQVWIHIKPVSRALPTGQVAYGFYTLVDGVVTMTDAKGKPATDEAGKVYTHKLETNDDANIIAGRLTRQLRDALLGKKDVPPSGFGAPAQLSEGGHTLMRKFVTWSNLKCEYGNGSWALIDGIVFVRTCNGSKATQLGGHLPEGIARLLIRELEAGDRPEDAA